MEWYKYNRVQSRLKLFFPFVEQGNSPESSSYAGTCVDLTRQQSSFVYSPALSGKPYFWILHSYIHFKNDNIIIRQYSV